VQLLGKVISRQWIVRQARVLEYDCTAMQRAMRGSIFTLGSGLRLLIPGLDKSVCFSKQHFLCLVVAFLFFVFLFQSVKQ